jgi:serine/threonine-protein kinase
MAPELFDGEPANPRSDVYAMGVTLYFLLTGQYPFVEHSVIDLARMHAENPLPDIRRTLPDLSADVVAVLQRSLAKNPFDRYAEAGQLHDDLKAAYGGLRSLETVVREAFAGSDVAWQGDGNRFTAVVRLPEGRSQNVIIEASRDVVLSEQVVRIYSSCAPAAESYYRRALEINATLSHGSIGIEPVGEQNYFVMGNAYPRSTCDPEEVRRSVYEIARHADQVEHSLTGDDRH